MEKNVQLNIEITIEKGRGYVPASLERFARENYGHKKENETIFIIETGELEKISQ